MTTKTNTFGLSYAREIYVKVLGEKIKVNDEGDRLKTLIDDLGWEYQRRVEVAEKPMMKYSNFLVVYQKTKFGWRFKNDFQW